MKYLRIIPRLDIKGPNLVKGIHLEGLRVLGKPEQFAEYYYHNGADELVFVDVVASLYERNSLHDIIKKTAKKIFIPLTVSGGIRSIDDIKHVLRAGADKVSLNTAAVKDPSLIRQAVQEFGSSTIVVTIEAIKQADGSYLLYTDNGREHTGKEVVQWAKTVEEFGAGEIVITSVDMEGTGKGFDNELTRMVSEAVGIPVVAHGGAGRLDDLSDVVFQGKADAIALASMLHYHTIDHHQSSDTFDGEGNIEFLKSGRSFSNMEKKSLDEIKTHLHHKKVPCRYYADEDC